MMDRMIVKVCGMRDGNNIRALEMLDIDWLGFIFYPSSPRYVYRNGKPNDISSCTKTKAGVFVNAQPKEILREAAEYQLDYLQLHGDESPDDCRRLQEEGYRVIKAFSVSSGEDLRQTSAYELYVDFFLFDTKNDKYGGSGQRFDWSALEAYQGCVPFLLSGGIGHENMQDLLAFSHPLIAGVDLNSRFELSPALKDSDMIERFVGQLNSSGWRHKTMLNIRN